MASQQDTGLVLWAQASAAIAFWAPIERMPAPRPIFEAPIISEAEDREIAQARRQLCSKKALPAPEQKLPFWPDAVQPVPNDFFHAALFSVRKNGRGALLPHQKMESLEGIEAYGIGVPLGLGHLAACLVIARALRGKEYGRPHRLTLYALLKIIGLPDTGKNRATLEKYIWELASTVLTIKHGSYSFNGCLLAYAAKDEKTGKWLIEFNLNLAHYFTPGQFSLLNWAIWRALNGKQVAQWLYAFYSTHAKPYAYSMMRLLELMGSCDENPRSSRQTLREALDTVSQICAQHGQEFRYEIKSDLVHVQKALPPPLRKTTVE